MMDEERRLLGGVLCVVGRVVSFRFDHFLVIRRAQSAVALATIFLFLFPPQWDKYFTLLLTMHQSTVQYSTHHFCAN